MAWTIHHGDCREVMATLDAESVDAIVSDPPYGLSFMGKGWDHGVPGVEFWTEAMRVAKPGAHLLAFGGTRTYHRLACAIEDAGWEIRDCVMWVYGSGFPKSHDVSKAIDKRKDWKALPLLQSKVREARLALGISQSEAARRCGLIAEDESLGGGGFMWFETGMRMPTREQYPRLKDALGLDGECDEAFEEAEREVTGAHVEWTDRTNYALTSKDGLRRDIPATDAARQWSGWGTALKPSWEPVIVARKPLVGTVAENVLRHGTGGINVDGCRVEGQWSTWRKKDGTISEQNQDSHAIYGKGMGDVRNPEHTAGRWPANLIHDGSEDVVGLFPVTTSGALNRANITAENGIYGKAPKERTGEYAPDSGSAARFFYCAKASKADRDEGCEGMEEHVREAKYGTVQDARPHTPEGYEYHREPRRNHHPTVKPTALMRYLCRLVTPPGGIVLDPFTGSGSTGKGAVLEGFRFIGIEREAEYVEIAKARIGAVESGPGPLFEAG
jgi:DNA modification methylase/transcriptional regulator with XRE-family HTH domain